MNKQSRTLAAVLAVVIAICFPNIAAYADSWAVPQPNTAPSDGSWVVVNESGGFDLWSVRASHRSSGGSSEGYVCAEGLGPKACDFNDPTWVFDGSQILPFCESASQENCVEGIAAVKADGTVLQGKFLHTVEGERWKAVPETGLYEATMPALFDIPGAINSGGTSTYVVALKTQVSYDRGAKRFVTRSMSANVFAYSTKSSGSQPTRTLEKVDSDGVTRIYQNHDPNCLFSETGVCGVEQDFPKDTAFQVTARIPNELAGWFHGRMTKQEISIDKFSASNNKVSIKANPVNVARMAVIATRSNSSQQAQDMLMQRGGHGGYTAFNGNSIKDFWATEGAGAFFALNEWRDEMKDTAAGISTEWNFATVANQAGNQCMKDTTKVLGMVTTNATLYSGAAPEFVGGQLKYTVGGLHFQPDGTTLNEGTYDLLMRSDVARCLYGFSKAPISATISVVGEGGENKVATTVVRETKDGWLNLAAYGFSFSSPTISVKLSQANASAKKTTITCVKGKLTKNVTAVGPKCPTGYKKK
jgi:hypothetical protein